MNEWEIHAPIYILNNSLGERKKSGAHTVDWAVGFSRRAVGGGDWCGGQHGGVGLEVCRCGSSPGGGKGESAGD